jgi:hypothetical protein
VFLGFALDRLAWWENTAGNPPATRSFRQSKTLTPPILSREKANAVKRNGLLEVCLAAASQDDIGGLELRLLRRKDACGAEATRLAEPAN